MDQSIKTILILSTITLLVIVGIYIYTIKSPNKPTPTHHIPENNTNEYITHQNKDNTTNYIKDKTKVILYLIHSNDKFPIENNRTFIHISLKPLNNDFTIQDINSTCEYKILLTTGKKTDYLKISKNTTQDFIIEVNLNNDICDLLIGDKIIKIKRIDNLTVSIEILNS